MPAFPYIKVKTDSIVDLEKISDKYALTVEEILNFHNKHCRVHEPMPEQLPKIVELKMPSANSHKSYGISIKYPLRQLQIHYTFEIERSGKGTLQISRGRTCVNNQEFESQIEKLAETASEALFPLQLSLHSNGSVDKILNHNDILTRWKAEVQPKLYQYYLGDVSEDLIKKIDHSFTKLESDTSLLMKNALFQLFFQPVYQRYNGLSKKQQFQFYFPSLYRVVDYDADWTLDHEFTQSSKIALRINGTEKNNLCGMEKNKGTVDLLYKFHRESHDIFSITGTLSYFENNEEQMIDIQIFELK